MNKNLLAIFLLLFTQNSFCQNHNLSNGMIFDGEPFIAVNPSNPRHMVVAWMGFVFQNRLMIKTRVSEDGGNSWSQVQQTPHVEEGYTSADPSLAFDSNGNVFLCLIDHDPNMNSGAVYVRKSINGGLNWGEPVTVLDYNADPGKLPIDRPWISIDRSGGDNNGNIYITTVNATGASGPPYHPYFIRSLDNGASFEPWRFADTTGWLSGSLISKPMATPVVSSDGTFHCIYPSYVFSQGLLPKFVLASSDNAGTGFSYKTVYASGTTVAVSDTSAKKGYLLRADPSDPGHIAFFNLANDLGDSDIFFRESFDVGLTWTEGIRVNDDPAGNDRMQDLVWAGFDTDGDLAVTWRDRRHAADTGYAASYEIYCATRLNESSGFSENFRISDVSIPFDEVLLENGNDFMCVDLYNDTLNAVWGDTRNGKLNIWFQRVTLNGTPVGVQQLASEYLPDVGVIQTGQHNLQLKGDKISGFRIFNPSGIRVIYSGTITPRDNVDINISGLSSGFYLLNVETINGIITKKIIIK